MQETILDLDFSFTRYITLQAEYINLKIDQEISVVLDQFLFHIYCDFYLNFTFEQDCCSKMILYSQIPVNNLPRESNLKMLQIMNQRGCYWNAYKKIYAGLPRHYFNTWLLKQKWLYAPIYVMQPLLQRNSLHRKIILGHLITSMTIFVFIGTDAFNKRDEKENMDLPTMNISFRYEIIAFYR